MNKRESKKNRDKAYRLRKKFARGHTISKKDNEWLSEYERRVLIRQIQRQPKEKKKYKAKREVTRTPTKKALQAYTNAFKRFLSWYGITIKSIKPRPYGSGIIISASVGKTEMADIDTKLEYPFDIVADSLKGHIANVRVKLVSDRLFRWKSLAPLMEVDDVFIRAGSGLVKWALMMYPSSFEYREEHIVIFDSYFRRETPMKGDKPA